MTDLPAMQGWAKIRSWHAVLTPTRVPDRYLTWCGRRATGPILAELPAGRSCESCLRNLEWANERRQKPRVDVTEFLAGPA